ncbi:cytochrome b5 [Metschnikowia bicuspidata var. bicuspidata NRRL YB-4993]|uniref:Cytochrome b5 n=1 Tax=Metschnikowia bicuspidata var. bicuspidata NRRL YB-4993 TaxID=869754 RepID=A0A1A0HK97_9ASCO|nr:cytochrome b5 [Metschnikowia bicuspidata var. bicuspidata NRRL YB-4993]OBA24445.1 cytochrome b5 [Metschnikowia bicuspidata var. bicuspidata NRRL YB-4993]
MLFTILIVLIIAYLSRSIILDLTSNPLAETAQPQEPPVQTKFVPSTLSKYDGKNDTKVFIAIKGVVFDVTAGKGFYGPGGPYENFAGRDASRGLALNSFDPSVLTALNEPLDTLADLSLEEKESLENWKLHFEKKYIIVGSLHNPGEIDL